MSAQGGHSGAQYFSLRWNNHPANLVSVFSGLYTSETLVDVTLAAEGKHIQAHKMLLSACSDYFQSLFSINPCQHPIVILKDVRFEDLQTVVQFMYNGVVNVSSEKLPAVLKTADTLQIKGLGEKFSESVNQMMGSSNYSSSSRLLSVPSQHSVNSRQLSTESLPEYLHRTRDFSPRQASTESRQYSIESSVSALVRKQPTPPASPPRHYRKKFRKMSGGESSSELGNSLEDDRSPSFPTNRASTPPTIHLSPSRQSSSSTDHEGMVVAKKKRELFSARSSRSGGSNQSSASEYSREHSFKHLESSGSSGQSHSISQSQDDPAAASAAAAAMASAAAAAAATPSSSSSAAAAALPSLSTYGRTLARAQSAGESSTNPPCSKRGRFLKRQDCLEKGMDLTTDGAETEVGLNLQQQQPTIKSSPNSPLSYPCLGSPADSKILSSEHHPQQQQGQLSPQHHPPPPPPLTKQKSQPLPPSDHHHRSSATAAGDSSSLYYSVIDTASLPPPSASTHKLPSVRVIPDAANSSPTAAASAISSSSSSSDPLDHKPVMLPVPNMRLLCPPEFTTERRLPLVKSRSTDSSFNEQRVRGPIAVAAATQQHAHHMTYEPLPLNYGPPHQPRPLPPSSSSAPTSSPVARGDSPATSSGLMGESIDVLPLLQSQHHHPPPPPNDQFGHCPKAREGPALGCNYCWNTTDANGRILRRKTKYHCPECQANLCIVPCFQQYHEALERERGMSPR